MLLAKDVKLGLKVRVNKTTEEMRAMNFYGGSHDKGDVLEVTSWVEDGYDGVRLGGEIGACWINLACLELAEETVQPAFFKDLSDEEKGAILFARFNGEPYQLYNPLVGAWYDDTDMIDDDMAYRLKPQELIEAENRKKDLIAALDELEEQLSAY